MPEAAANIFRGIVWASGVAGIVIILYLAWGLLSGAWANPIFMHLGHDERLRHMNNITMCQTALKLTAWVFILSLLAITFQDASIGYILLACATVFYFGFPFLASEILGFQNFRASSATQDAIADVQGIAIIFGVPGIIWTFVDFVRRMQSAAENSAIQRANLKYGSTVKRQTQKKQRNVFLGRCWELAYCRDNVRLRCPIFLKKRGPCWWYKQGCMCDERIVLKAVIDSDWKEKSAAAVASGSSPVTTLGKDLGLDTPNVYQPQLSMAKKIERCQGCVIFNEHQRQKYHAMVVAAFVAVPSLLFFDFAGVQQVIVTVLNEFELLTRRLSLTSDASGPILTGNEYSPALEWVLIIAACVIIMSQILRLIEYICFKLKI